MGRGPAPATAKLGVCPSLRRQRYAASHAAKITGTGPPVTGSAHQAKLHSVRFLREVGVKGPPSPPIDPPDHDDVDAWRQRAPRQPSPTPRHDVSVTGDLHPFARLVVADRGSYHLSACSRSPAIPSMRTNGSLVDGGHRRRPGVCRGSVAAIGCRLGCCTVVLHFGTLTLKCQRARAAGDYQLGNERAS
jgi:hypothetical protein